MDLQAKLFHWDEKWAEEKEDREKCRLAKEKAEKEHQLSRHRRDKFYEILKIHAKYPDKKKDYCLLACKVEAHHWKLQHRALEKRLAFLTFKYETCWDIYEENEKLYKRDIGEVRETNAKQSKLIASY